MTSVTSAHQRAFLLLSKLLKHTITLEAIFTETDAFSSFLGSRSEHGMDILVNILYNIWLCVFKVQCVVFSCISRNRI